MITKTSIDINLAGLRSFEQRANKLKQRAEKLGLPFDYEVVPNSQRGRRVRVRNVFDGEEGASTYIEVQTVAITLTLPEGGIRYPGGWRFVATLENVGKDELDASRILPQDLELVNNLRQSTDLSCACDHCHKRRNRNALYVVQSQDGELRRVGRECLSHYVKNAEQELFRSEFYAEVINFVRSEEITDSSQVAFEHVSWPQRAFDFVEILSEIVACVRSHGFQPSNVRNTDRLGYETTEPNPHATWRKVRTALETRETNTDIPEIYPAPCPSDIREAEEFLQWLLSREFDAEHEDGALTLQDYAKRGWISGVRIPLLCAFEQIRERVERRDAEKNKIIKPVPAAFGRVVISGVAKSFKEVRTQFGVTLKMLVEHKDGWRVWSTVPRGVPLTFDVGSPIKMVATLEKSDDPFFCFASRPTIYSEKSHKKLPVV